jgi:hypothetical protein
MTRHSIEPRLLENYQYVNRSGLVFVTTEQLSHRYDARVAMQESRRFI